MSADRNTEPITLLPAILLFHSTRSLLCPKVWLGFYKPIRSLFFCAVCDGPGGSECCRSSARNPVDPCALGQGKGLCDSPLRYVRNWFGSKLSVTHDWCLFLCACSDAFFGANYSDRSADRWCFIDLSHNLRVPRKLIDGLWGNFSR